MIESFRLFGSIPKTQKLSADIKKFTKEQKEKMRERLNILREKQREATRIISENANKGIFKNTDHIFSKEDRAELDKLNSQIGGKRRIKTHKKRGRKRRKVHKTHKIKGRKAHKSHRKNNYKSRNTRRIQKKIR